METGSASNLRPSAPVLPTEIKIVSYNMRWRGGDELRRLIVMLREDAEIGGAAIIGLQEVDRNKQRTGNVNTARTIAEALGMHYVWTAPPTAQTGQEEETGVAILSSYPLMNVERIVLPNEGPGKRRRVALGATLRIGTTDVRVYSVHAETRIPVEKKMDQLHAVLKDLQRRPKTEQAIVLGDFNTIKGKDVRACIKLFTDEGLTAAIPHDQATWKTFIFKLKLDWVWLRGLEATGSGIVHRITLSDHWPLWVRVKFGGDGKTSIQPSSSKADR
ncbi:MAG: endonuclease/exonuclease/phosphatase family protein [Pyrinomonadaceae bacterium]|nr:endonuclease/exonuclease/phosphatase family protein [Pyrinomonadaceae bacterium]